MVADTVPVIKESVDLPFTDTTQKTADFGIAVVPHFIRKKRMVKRKIRIILTSIFFINNQICD